jgi:hypothetical protein
MTHKNISRRIGIALVVFIVAALFPSKNVFAGEWITPGERKTGSLSDSDSFDFWYFMGSRGDRVTITMNKTSGDLDPVLGLWIYTNGNWEKIEENDAYGTGQNARIDSFLLPSDEEFAIGASGYGSTTGRYSLQLQIAGSSDSSSSADDSSTGEQSSDSIYWIIPGQRDTGSLPTSDSIGFWHFNGSRGDRVTITMNKTSGDLDPVLTLWAKISGDWEQIEENDDYGTGQNARINRFSLPSETEYAIGASGYGSTTGRYSLQLQIVGGADSSSSADNTLSITPDAYIDFPDTDGDGITDQQELWIARTFIPVYEYDEDEHPHWIDDDVDGIAEFRSRNEIKSNKVMFLFQVSPVNCSRDEYSSGTWVANLDSRSPSNNYLLTIMALYRYDYVPYDPIGKLPFDWGGARMILLLIMEMLSLYVFA